MAKTKAANIIKDYVLFSARSVKNSSPVECVMMKFIMNQNTIPKRIINLIDML